MKDRELLELAAKAAGIEGTFENDGEKAGLHLNWPENPSMWKRWHPLEDDGDALRLAVRLKLPVDTEAAHRGAPDDKCDCPMHRTEPYAATRRAIVRAAAEIGCSMNRSE